MDDQNNQVTPGEGQSVETPTPTDSGFQIPEKFQGASEKESLEKAVKAYSELERKLGERSQTPDVTKIIDNKFNELRQALEAKNTPPTEEEESMRQQREMGIKLGFATKEDVAQAEEKGYRKAMTALTFTQLEQKYNGSDGKPKFESQKIAEYVANQAPEWIKSAPPEAIYEYMHKQDLDAWKVADAMKRNKAPSVPGGNRTPTPPSKPTKDMTREEIKAQAIARLNAQQEA